MKQTYLVHTWTVGTDGETLTLRELGPRQLKRLAHMTNGVVRHVRIDYAGYPAQPTIIIEDPVR